MNAKASYRFLILILLLRSHELWGAEFTPNFAESVFKSARKPVLSELQETYWLQIGGSALFDPARASWSPGPIGYSETGIFPPVHLKGTSLPREKALLDFQGKNESSEYLLQVATHDLSFDRPMVMPLYSPYTENENSVQFTLSPINQNFSALFECKSKPPQFLICAASLQLPDPNAEPSLAPFAGKVFYWALYRRENSAKAKALSPSLNQNPVVEPKMKARGFKCVMNWMNGSQQETVSFTLLPKTAKLGSGSMAGIGASWGSQNPKDMEKVIVVSASEVGGLLTVGILKPISASGFSSDWDLSNYSTNSNGLPMVGTISIPRGGGRSSVKYPPGSGQTWEDYQKTLLVAPDTANCEEREVDAPPNPYLWDVGIVR